MKKWKQITYWITVVERFTEFLQGIKKFDIVFSFICVIRYSAINIPPSLKINEKKLIVDNNFYYSINTYTGPSALVHCSYVSILIFEHAQGWLHQGLVLQCVNVCGSLSPLQILLPYMVVAIFKTLESFSTKKTDIHNPESNPVLSYAYLPYHYTTTPISHNSEKLKYIFELTVYHN